MEETRKDALGTHMPQISSHQLSPCNKKVSLHGMHMWPQSIKSHHQSGQSSPKRLALGLLPWKSLKSTLPSLHKEQFGTPSYPSPLDRIRTGRCERALQLGLSQSHCDPHNINQSFPSTVRPHFCQGDASPDMGDLRKSTLDKFKGDALNSFSFSLGCSKGSFARPPESVHHGRSLSGSWVFYNFVGGGQTGTTFPTSVQNPNKAIVTINARTTEILVANKMACQLLGLPTRQLSGKRLCEFFISRKGQYALTETELEASGEVVVISGKVMDLVNSEKEVQPVSVWVRKLPTNTEPRCLVVMEPVERTTTVVTFDSKGKLLKFEKNLATLLGYLLPQELEGAHITDLIPSLVLPSPAYADKLPQEIRKQRATGRTRDGATFPLSILIEPVCIFEDERDDSLDVDATSSIVKNSENVIYRGVIWVFANISGMITVLPDGTIHSCNTNFSLMLFGYSQDQLVGKNITMLIPSFYDDLEFLDTDSMPLPPLDDEDEEESHAHCCCASDGRTTADSLMTDPPRPVNPLGKQIELMLEDTTSAVQGLTISPGTLDAHSSSTVSPVASSPCIEKHQQNSFGAVTSDKNSQHIPVVSLSYSEDSALQDCNPGTGCLKISDSQETLHSYTDSITESDINGNILDISEKDEPIKGYKRLEEENEESIKETENAGGDASLLIQISKTSNSSKCHEDDITPVKEENPPSPNECGVVKETDNTCRPENSFHSETHLNSISIGNSCSSEKHEPNISSESKLDHAKNFHDQKASDTSTPKDSTTLSEKLTAILTSHLSDESLHSIPEGSYFGLGRHRDDSDLAIVYQVRRVELDDGKILYCLWVSRDPEEAGEGGRPYRSLTLASSLNSTMGLGLDASTHSLGPSLQEKSVGPTHPVNQSIEPADAEYIAGPYAEKYTTLQQIGKGAFGCVKMAYHKCDGLLVITKFIRKSKVYEECWVYDSLIGRRVPLEVSLLTTLKHPNIVQVLDVFENEDYFQMVMEKHGAGMDLFEFIDRNPTLDEPLASYIFRQVVSALSYLHSLNILHRDIKDENIIVDEYFHVKLIDFGSATFMAPDRFFSTFCGTREYCSPEVIRGNQYQGPELEMWALGVTLYTLIFGENPFFDVDETIAAVLKPPFRVSQDLMHLISWLLHPDPEQRCTLCEVEEHPWTNQPVHAENYKFEDVVSASQEEINPPKYFQADHPAINVSSLEELLNSKTEPEEQVKHHSNPDLSGHSQANSFSVYSDESQQEDSFS